MIATSRYVLLNIFHIIVDGLFDSVPILLAFMAAAFGAGEKQIGLVVSLGVLAGTLGGLTTSYMAGRYGFLHVLCCTSLLYGIGFLANAFSTGMLFTGFFFVIAVAGHTLFHNAAFSYLSGNVERERLGKTLSDFTAYGDIGRIPLTSLAAFAAAFSVFGLPGWRLVCFAYGLLALAIGLYLAAILRRATPALPETHDKGKHGVFPSFDLLKSRGFLRTVVASMTNALSGDQVFVFLPLLLFAKGVEPRVFGAFAFAFTAGCFLGKMAFGRLVDRFGNRLVFTVAQLAAAALLLLLVVADGLAAITLTAICLGIVNKGSVPVVQTLLTDSVADKRRYHDVFTLNGLFRGGVNTVAPIAYGLIAAKWGIASIYCLMAVLAVVSVLPLGIGRHPVPGGDFD